VIIHSNLTSIPFKISSNEQWTNSLPALDVVARDQIVSLLRCVSIVAADCECCAEWPRGLAGDGVVFSARGEREALALAHRNLVKGTWMNYCLDVCSSSSSSAHCSYTTHVTHKSQTFPTSLPPFLYKINFSPAAAAPKSVCGKKLRSSSTGSFFKLEKLLGR
jgi:hypothetical protein